MKAFTYDDILMVPSYNHWGSRKVVDISMKCKTGKLSLKVPLMTANMDTITESDMANFIGEKGGIAEWKTAERVSTEVPYREDEDEIIADIIGGLRSGLTYGGAATIKELQRELDYIEITSAGRWESLPHRTI